ncbi:hypothetical protein OVA24_11785 [Luteolibacter sp. SL250]|nr:hypothetical protein [Luteolibacter sp. SL250]WAC17922.1 hypothetical protein OVA24_11785 [Luteolibacter sp. SL250]
MRVLFRSLLCLCLVSWANNPLCNLSNRSGLPVVPFRVGVR